MIELGLQRISSLLAITPLPWKAIHVAGTNGKGSICAYLSGMLEVYNQSEYRRQRNQIELSHGRFTSPHLIDRWDCITVSGRTVEKSLFEAVEKMVLARNRNEVISASEFELMTATAFEIFAHLNLDIAVVEVGMGGRLDATNVIGQPIHDQASPESPRSSAMSQDIKPEVVDKFRPPPLVTAISKIGMDHQAFLGNYLEAIAREKAGIIKPGVPVVYDFSNETTVRNVLEDVAQDAESPVVKWADLTPTGIEWPYDLLPLDELEETDNRNLSRLQTNLRNQPGHISSHVQRNTSVALRSAWTALQRLGRLPLKAEIADVELWSLVRSMAEVPRCTIIPGRQEWVEIGRLTGESQKILLDGAHNAQSAIVLGQYVEQLRMNSGNPHHDSQPMVWILAASDTKDVKEILQPLLKAVDHVFAVEFGPVDSMPWVRPMAASEILSATVDLVPALKDSDRLNNYGTDLLAALKAASKASQEAGCNLVVAGSLYLAGIIHRLLREHSS